MRADSPAAPWGIFLLSLLFAVSFCSADDKTLFQVVGTADCADCKEYNVKTSQAFSGLRVSIDCKIEKGEMKRIGDGELDKEGKFKISVQQQELIKKDCYAQLHSTAAVPCPNSHNGLESTKIVLKSQNNNGIQTFGPNKNLKFSTILCASKIFWPYFKYPPLSPLTHPYHSWPPLPPLTHPWKKSYHSWPPLPPLSHSWPPLPPLSHPWKKSYHLPPPVPVPVPAVPISTPTPVYTPPVPVPTPVPEYKPLPPPVPVPIYKPKPPVYKPKPPVYKPKPPVYKPKPPVYKPKPPVYKPVPPVYKPIPPSVPIYNKPPVYKKPCPPVKKLPPLPKFPPKYFHHPKYGYFPPLPPHHP